MIKSNRDIKDIIKLEKLVPQHIEGHVCIDLTDPVTGKVKERVSGKNTVFSDALFLNKIIGNESGLSNAFVARTAMWNSLGYGLGSVMLALNNDDTAIDSTFPYLRGQTIGYGIPSYGSSGTFRGAYNAANQVLGEFSLTKQRWKYQYDFTTAQANSGTIKNVGLTYQYYGAGGITRASTHGLVGNATMQVAPLGCCSSGRYACTIPYSTTTGIVTKYDMWIGATTTYDLSATIGTSGSDYKYVGYSPATGKWYIYKYSSTAANRRMYVFSDDTFSTLENTYTISNISITNSSNSCPFYVYGNYMYFLYLSQAYSSGFFVAYADFINNVAQSTRYWLYDSSHCNNAMWNEGLTDIYPSMYAGRCSIGTQQGIWLLNPTYSIGVLYDPVNDSRVLYFYNGIPSNSNYGSAFMHPLLSSKIPSIVCQENTYYKYYVASLSPAITTYILPTPITKTSANGMTATYELEVNW